MERKFGLKDKLGYMFGDFGNDFFFMLVSSFLMVFYTKVLGISAATVGTLFLVARIVDAFTDVGMGRIVDKKIPTKNGKFRPFIRFMSIPVVLSGVLLFVPWVANLPHGIKLVYIYTTYILWGSICYTGINIPYGSMASAITSDPVERGELSTFRSIGASLAAIVVNVGVPLFIYKYDVKGNQIIMPNRFFVIALIFALLAFICYVLCYKLSVERVKIAPKDVKKEGNGPGLKDILKSMVKNKSLVAIVGAAIVLLLSMIMTQSMNVYLFMDYFKSKQAMALVGFLGIGATLILAPFSKIIIKKIGKKEASSVSMLSAAIIYGLLFILKIKNPWVFCIFVGLGNFGTGLFNLMIWAFITDVIDYQEVTTGSRDDGTVYAVYSFARKLGQALAGGLGGWILGAIGYRSSIGGETIVQTTEVLNGIYNVATVIPAICYLIVALILIFIYPLSKKVVEKNTVILAKRREN